MLSKYRAGMTAMLDGMIRPYSVAQNLPKNNNAGGAKPFLVYEQYEKIANRVDQANDYVKRFNKYFGTNFPPINQSGKPGRTKDGILFKRTDSILDLLNAISKRFPGIALNTSSSELYRTPAGRLYLLARLIMEANDAVGLLEQPVKGKDIEISRARIDEADRVLKRGVDAELWRPKRDPRGWDG